MLLKKVMIDRGKDNSAYRHNKNTVFNVSHNTIIKSVYLASSLAIQYI